MPRELLTSTASVPASDERPVQRLEQRFHYSYPSPIRDLRHRLVTVPPRRHGRQVRLDHGLHVSGDPVLVSTHRDAFDNLVIDVRATAVDEWIELRSWALVAQDERVAGGPATSAAMATIFRCPTPLTVADGRIADAVSQLRAGGASGGLDLAERICAWTFASFRYHDGITTVATSAAEALAGGVGVCQDYAHVMLAACRSAGIGARYVSGHLAGEGGSHAWVEVLVPVSATGRFEAVAFDPTHDRRAAGPGYLTVAVGRDYADVAPTSGSFSGPCAGVLRASKVLREATSSAGEP